MEKLNHILEGHTDLIFYGILVVIFGFAMLKIFLRRMRNKHQRRRFDDPQ
ncbi:MAG TPA: hypothetical protein VMG30_21500 [Acidobacteriota bacterium]|nr:hypothetical protein [Acidobacteriota bacterium]